ncbi:hypothetical protein ACJ5NV_03930 [Loktanella agnita]|uniref:hypothetical protein n=1 Tax=Loktanella agnita TaxID=287097 RepID=UPI0039860FCC
MINVARSVAPQVDRLNLILNEYTNPIPELVELENVHQIIPDQDLKDTGKFLPDIGQSEFVFLIDDDLIYPKDYVSDTISHLKDLGHGIVVGYHGSLFYRRPPLRISRRALRKWWEFSPKRIADNRKVLHFSHAIEDRLVVDQLGTGTVALHATQYPEFDFMRTSKRFVDVRFARWCFQNNWRQVILPRPEQWIGEAKFPETIFRGFTKSHDQEVAAEIRSFARKASGLGKPV